MESFQSVLNSSLSDSKDSSFPFTPKEKQLWRWQYRLQEFTLVNNYPVKQKES